ncbi:hypothetical protein ACFPRL_28560 [Pseudoclavibacter helvolus]
MREVTPDCFATSPIDHSMTASSPRSCKRLPRSSGEANRSKTTVEVDATSRSSVTLRGSS